MKTLLRTFLSIGLLIPFGMAYSQTNPEPFPLIYTNFTFEGFADNTSTVYPVNMNTWSGPTPLVAGNAKPDPALQCSGDAPLKPFTDLPATYVARNEGDKGISTRGSSDIKSPLAIALAINTKGTKGLKIKWSIKKATGYTGITSGVQLQYRVGTTGNWTNFQNPYRYYSGVSVDSTYGPINLPAALEDKDVVQFRWFTFCISTTGTANGTNRLTVDGIELTATTRDAPPTPISKFGYTALGKQITFTDSSTNTPTKWAWDFGDLSVDSVQNPVHIYSSPGDYLVQLIASNSSGADTTMQQILVKVGGDSTKAPIASFSFIINKDTVSFFDESDNFPGKFAWDFGDGTIDSIANPIHVYDSAKVYQVCLIATSVNGSDTICNSVEPDITIGLNTISENQLFSVYPNPSTGSVNLYSKFEKGYTLSVFDVLGNKVLCTQLFGNRQTIDLTKLNKGIYILTLSDENEMSTQKISLF